MSPFLQPLQDTARGAACALRAALRRAALIGVALLIASLGAAFLMFAAYLGLRFLVGPVLAALILGAVLLALAGGVLMLARSVTLTAPPIPMAPPKAATTATPPQPADAATMAVFTAAFLLGRSLAASWADRRGRPGIF